MKIGGKQIVACLAVVKFLLHMLTANLYGPFIDELYFLASGERLAWGYVDFPPLTAVQAWLARALLGDSMYAIRLFPALAGAGLVLLTGALVRALGGRRFAQGLAALCVLVSPVYLAFDSYLSMNSIEPLIWMGCAYFIIRMIQTGDTRLWLWFGGLAGIGLLNKHTMLMFGFAIVAGLALTRERRLMWNRWILAGGALAFAVFLPNLVWMAQHHFPHLEVLANIKRNGRDIIPSPPMFLFAQILMMLPATAPVWIAGLWGFLSGRPERRYRSLGWTYLISLAVLLVTGGKVYYLMPIYPMLLAGGAVVFEAWLERPRFIWVKAAYAAAIVLWGSLIAPTMIPILSPEGYLRYAQATGLAQPRFENRATGPLPQFFADRFGWPEMVEAVARVYNSLPPEERARAAIIGNDYGQCGAIDLYGPKLGLPKAIGTHLSYWLWGPRDYTGEIIIVLGDNKEGAGRWFDSVEEVGRVAHPYAMRQEHFTILLCRQLKRGATLRSVWPMIKNYN